jgi:hypothetical protein
MVPCSLTLREDTVNGTKKRAGVSSPASRTHTGPRSAWAPGLRARIAHQKPQAASNEGDILMWPMLANLWLVLSSPARRKAASRRRPALQRLSLETLEDRTVPSTLHVTNALDDGSAGSLRSVLASAQNGDKVVFDGSLAGQTITLTSFIRINVGLTIEGPAGPNKVTISGGGGGSFGQQFYCFERSSDFGGGPLAITNLNFVNAPGTAVTVDGGTDTPVTFNNCSFSGNTGGTGGALQISGPGDVYLNSCIFTGNSGIDGGAILMEGFALHLDHCTVSGNSAFDGGGIRADDIRCSIVASTVANNVATLGADIFSNNGHFTLVASNIGDFFYRPESVTIDVPANDVGNLITQVAGLAQAGTLSTDQASGLTSKLQAAEQSLANGQVGLAVNQLSAFLNQVNALVHSNTLTPDLAQPLLDAANQIISELNSTGAL